MAYTAPITFIGGDPFTAAQMNVVQDNIAALKDPPRKEFNADEVSDYTTTSATFVDVDATVDTFNLTITTTGGDVEIGFHGSVNNASISRCYFDVLVNGVREGLDDGLIVQGIRNTDARAVSFTRIVNLSAGTHIFKLQWKINTGTVTLYAGAGTSTFDVHPQFYVREV